MNVERLRDLLHYYKELTSVGMQGITRITKINNIQNNIAILEVLEDVTKQYEPIISRIEIIIEEMEGEL